MAAGWRSLLLLVLLASSGLHRCSSLPPCPDSCSCPTPSQLNCSSAGLSSVPRFIQDSVTQLDLSHNLLVSVALDRPHHELRSIWLGNNSIASLSLCVERRRPRRWRGRRCLSWCPVLQLLSVERNQLQQLPQGLEVMESLQVLRLSFNRISTLRPEDLRHLRHLKELHLQHNLITVLCPETFQGLTQLQVLDVSFNMLTSLHPAMYFSLRNMGAEVKLGGNRWRCDCSVLSLRRWMSYDSSRGLQTWRVECDSPSVLSGKDLLQLEDDDLDCLSPEDRPELHRDVTADKGSEILLSCSAQDPVWWTPGGPAPVSQTQAGLVINDIAETDAGLYVCVSEDHKVVSVYNLHISKMGGARRKTRSLPGTSQIIPQASPDRIDQNRNQRATQSDLALAVCLSVFITFLVAFVLGVLARPCVERLWKRVTKKKSSSPANPASTGEQRQYDNEAFCSAEEPEHMGTRRERRVTFSMTDFREEGNVKYYDTVAAEGDANTAGDSESENTLQQSSPEGNRRDLSNEGQSHNMEFERIPDPGELVERRSVSSDSSLSDKVFNEDQMNQVDHSTPKSSQLAEDPFQQRAESPTAEMPQISIEGTSERPGSSSDPFTDWSPHTNNNNLTDQTDPWQENEELFEFSDSVRSTSARSSGAFSDLKLTGAPSSKKQKADSMSSSSSYVGEDEPTQYTVNSDQEEEDIHRNHNKPQVLLDKQNHGVRPSGLNNEGDYIYKTQRPALRPVDSFSSRSSDSDGEDFLAKKGCIPSLTVSHSKSLDTRLPSSPAAYSSSSSSASNGGIKIKKPQTQWPSIDIEDTSSTDSEEETINHTKRSVKVDFIGPPLQGSLPKIHDPSMSWPSIDLEETPRINRRLDVKAPSPVPESSSSCDSEDGTTNHTNKKISMATIPHEMHKTASYDPQMQWPSLDLGHISGIERRLDVKAPPPSPDAPSSSDSDNETSHHKKIEGVLVQGSQTGSHDPDIRWPSTNLDHIPDIKRRLDIKAPSPSPDSPSSSDIEDETSHHTKRPVKVDITGPSLQGSQAGAHDPDMGWPSIDLEQVPGIKRRLDIKAPSPCPHSPSSSDSEDETSHHTKRLAKVDITGPPLQGSQAGTHDPDMGWPSIDLEQVPGIKRRLDIKAPSPCPDSPSSSDSEDETQHQKKIAELVVQESQPGSHDLDTRWHSIDLDHIPSIRRRLDVKAPSPASESSSSSDSEDGTPHHTKIQRKADVAELPTQGSQVGSPDPDIRWPSIDLEQLPGIKRRLDVKAPSPASESPSSSDSEDETSHYTKTPDKVDITGPPLQGSQAGTHDPDMRWPSIDLEQVPGIKRRLDIKAPSPASESPSSSDSEDETSHYTKTPDKVDITGPPLQGSQSGTHDSDVRWPSIDLEHVPSIKRRLDIKAPSPPPASPSSSDSEDETSHNTRTERLLVQGPQTGSHNPDKRWPFIDLEQIPRIKKLLDIKAPSPPPDSFLSDGRINYPVSKKTGEAIRMRPSLSTSGSDDQEGEENLRLPPTTVEPDSRWQRLDLSGGLHVKRRLDIKAHSPPSESSSNSDESEDGARNLNQKVMHDLHELSPGVPYINRRLDIKAPQPQPGDRSDSNSEDEHRDHAKLGLGVSAISNGTKPKFIQLPKAPAINISRSPKTDIKLEKYTVITDEMKTTSDNISTTLEVNPELQSRWATMNLGFSRYRKRLDISSNSPEPPSLPSSPPPDSPSNESWTSSRTRRNRRRIEGLKHIESSLILGNKPVDVSLSLKGQDGISVEATERSRTDYNLANEEKSNPGTTVTSTPQLRRYLDFKVREKETSAPPSKETSQSDLMWPRLSPTNISQIRKASDIRPVSQESSPSSNSEDESYRGAPDLSFGIPRIKRRLDVKAPLPESSNSTSSCSEGENYVTSNMSGMTDADSSITYKRVIMKASLLPSNTFYPSGKSQSIDLTKQSATSLAPNRVPSTTFDDVVKKRIEQPRSPTDVDLPSEIRWTGVGRQLSDLSVPSLRTHLGVASSTPAEPELSPPDSSSSESGDDKKEDGGKADAHSSPGVPLASGRALNKFNQPPGSTYEIQRATSVDRNERKGLSALRAMSSERRKWDISDENSNKGVSFGAFDDQQGDSSFIYGKSERAIRATDLLYGVARYRRHDISGSEPPQEAPPPVPATPPPYEAVGLTWRSPQSGKESGLEGTRSVPSRNTEKSDQSPKMSVYFDSSDMNMSEV